MGVLDRAVVGRAVRCWHDGPVQQQEFRPSFGRGLTVVIGALCGAATIGTLVTSGWATTFDVAPWLALVSGLCWAVFWRPCVIVSDGGVRLVNVLRTIDLPWPAITAIEIRWALTLDTAFGRFAAWAAPTNARSATRHQSRRSGDHGATMASVMSFGPRIGASDPSADAAALISARWNELRAAGHLDAPRLEHERVPVRWHVDVIAGAVGLGLLAAISVVT